MKNKNLLTLLTLSSLFFFASGLIIGSISHFQWSSENNSTSIPVTVTPAAIDSEEIPSNMIPKSMPVVGTMEDYNNPFLHPPGKSVITLSDGHIYNLDTEGNKSKIEFNPDNDYKVSSAIYNNSQDEIAVLIKKNAVPDVGVLAEGKLLLIDKSGNIKKILAHEGKDRIGFIQSFVFGNADKNIYITTSAGGPRSTIFEYDLSSGKQNEIGSGYIYGIIPEKTSATWSELSGELLVSTHDYYITGGGYDQIGIMNTEDGKMIWPVAVAQYNDINNLYKYLTSQD